MKICIGSKNREPIVLKWLTEFNKSEVLLFVEPQEYDNYFKLYSEKATIVNIVENDKGFSYLLEFMNNYILSLKEKYWIFLDDDILGFEKRIEGTKLKKVVDNKEIKDIFIELQNKIITENLSQIGLSFNVHNRFFEDEIDYNKGLWCALINNAEAIKGVGGYDLNIKIFSDWEMSARLISKNYRTAIYYKYAFNHQMKSRKGGAEFIYRDIELLNNSCRYIKNKYGDVVEIKFNESHGFNEVRFKWKLLKTQSNKLLKKGLF